MEIFSDSLVGPQKFHKGNIPRIGGLGIFLGFLFFIIYKYMEENNFLFFYILIPSFLVFSIGFLEDITKSISPRVRFLVIFLASILLSYLLEVSILRFDIPIIDNLLNYYFFSIFITAFAITGVANAYNIIDGFNGLASSVALLIFFSFCFISFLKGEYFIFSLSLSLIFSILGFLIWNYPFGKIFLGDGGAYFIGFIIGFISVYMVFKYKDISPWYPFLLSVYPIWETLYSMYRRRFEQNKKTTDADAFHFHSLIYKKVIPKFISTNNDILKNSLVTPILIVYYIPFILMANVFWDNTKILVIGVFIFITTYLFFYKSIIKLKLKFHY